MKPRNMRALVIDPRMSGFTPLRIQREILCRTSLTSYDNYISGQINCQQTRKVDY